MQHITAPELAAWLADEARAKPVLLDAVSYTHLTLPTILLV